MLLFIISKFKYKINFEDKKLIFLIIINITYAFFETLGIIDTTTIGAPSGETKTLVYKAYIDGFKGLDLGSAGAQSIIMMIIVLVITIFQFRFIESKVHYN